jgi:hypothetical protein
MPRPPRHRRSLVPGVDWLEGRRLLSQAAYCGPTPDRDDAREVGESPAASARFVTAIGPSVAVVSVGKTSAHVRDGADADAAKPPGTSEPDEDADSRSPAPELPIAAAPAPVVGLGAEIGGASEAAAAEPPGRRLDPSASVAAPSLAPASGPTTERRASSSTGDGDSNVLPPSMSPTSPPRAAEEPSSEAEAESPSALPSGAGLIAHALPFTAEMLTHALDEALDQFGDLGVIESVVSPRLATWGAVGLLALGSVAIARRLHRRDSEKHLRRVSSATVVPGLWPARL